MQVKALHKWQKAVQMIIHQNMCFMDATGHLSLLDFSQRLTSLKSQMSHYPTAFCLC